MESFTGHLPRCLMNTNGIGLGLGRALSIWKPGFGHTWWDRFGFLLGRQEEKGHEIICWNMIYKQWFGILHGYISAIPTGECGAWCTSFSWFGLKLSADMTGQLRGCYFFPHFAALAWCFSSNFRIFLIAYASRWNIQQWFSNISHCLSL